MFTRIGKVLILCMISANLYSTCEIILDKLEQKDFTSLCYVRTLGFDQDQLDLSLKVDDEQTIDASVFNNSKLANRFKGKLEELIAQNKIKLDHDCGPGTMDMWAMIKTYERIYVPN